MVTFGSKSDPPAVIFVIIVVTETHGLDSTSEKLGKSRQAGDNYYTLHGIHCAFFYLVIEENDRKRDTLTVRAVQLSNFADLQYNIKNRISIIEPAHV